MNVRKNSFKIIDIYKLNINIVCHMCIYIYYECMVLFICINTKYLILNINITYNCASIN